jgi:TPR repeat protein
MGLFGPDLSKTDKGVAAFKRRHWRRAWRMFEDAAEDGENSRREYYLGLLYWRGLGVARDAHMAVTHFSRAAELDHAGAMTAFAIALRSGIGVEKDAQSARQLFRLAAQAGDPEAMTQLAAMSDRDEARHWLVRAGELGHAAAMLALSDLLMGDEPIEALAWLYAGVALTGNDACRRRAGELAQEMTAAEIEAAQKAGRMYTKDIRAKARQ